MPRYAANLSTLFTEHEMLDRFAAAADAGFDHVEIQFPYAFPAELLGACARRAGVAVVLINAPPGDFAAGERGLAGLPDADARFMQSLELAAHYAAELGAGLVHVMSGIGDRSDKTVMRRLATRLAAASDVLAARQLTTVIEPINRFDMPGYLLADYDDAEWIIVDAARPHLRLLFDIYHRQRIAGEIAGGLERLLPLIGHVQIAGVPGRHEPVDGEVAYPWLLTRLDRLGYAGVVGCEYHPRGPTEEGLGWMTEGKM